MRRLLAALPLALLAACVQSAPVPAVAPPAAAPPSVASPESALPTASAPVPPDTLASPTPIGMANPASANCTRVGGALTIETTGSSGQIGVCTFDDNRQCEEWALLRGACPIGGVKVTGYATPGGRYCAILGGDYAATAAPPSGPTEVGSCLLPDGTTCDADALWAGTCPARS